MRRQPLSAARVGRAGKQRERGEGIEPPTGLPKQREDRVEDRELRAKRGDVGELEGKEVVHGPAEYGARSAALPEQRQTDRRRPQEEETSPETGTPAPTFSNPKTRF